MTYETLTTPRAEDPPSGPNLEYHQLFIDLELLAATREEQQIGDEVRPAEEPDFRKVEAKALEVLEQSHDLRAAIHLAVARLQTGGIEGFAEALDLIRRYLEQFWPTCHPELDAEDDDDPTMRVNAVKAVSDHGTVLRRLARAPLTDSRAFGKLSLADIDGAGDEDKGRVFAAFKDTPVEVLEARRAAVDAALAAVAAIDAKFDTETPGRGPELSGLTARLTAIKKHLAGAGSGAEEAVSTEEDAGMSDQSTPEAGPRIERGGVGQIRSTADVTAAIDQIVAFYQQTEPSSPVPIILNRAKRLVNADFLTIIRDIAPSGMDNVKTLGGLSDDD